MNRVPELIRASLFVLNNAFYQTYSNNLPTGCLSESKEVVANSSRVMASDRIKFSVFMYPFWTSELSSTH